MTTSSRVLQAKLTRSPGRWRTIAMIVALFAALWGVGFASGRVSAPDPSAGKILVDPGTYEPAHWSVHRGAGIRPHVPRTVNGN